MIPVEEFKFFKDQITNYPRRMYIKNSNDKKTLQKYQQVAANKVKRKYSKLQSTPKIRIPNPDTAKVQSDNIGTVHVRVQLTTAP